MNTKEVQALILKEYEDANKKFPMFNSMHEGIAVMSEEYDETKDELEKCGNTMLELWKCIKNNNKPYQNVLLTNLMRDSTALATEAIQFAAMVKKYAESFEIKIDSDFDLSDDNAF